MKIFEAVACLLLACVAGLIFMSVGANGWTLGWPISVAGLYLFTLFVSLPTWLATFVPFYLIAGPKALFWRWYIAPFVGAVLGFASSLILFAPTRYEFEDFTRQYLASAVIGFATFLLGTILKKAAGAEPSI